MKIALAGSAGTGKTTLAKLLAEEFGVPYIEEGMRTRLEQGLDLHSLSIEEHRELMLDMWAQQSLLEADSPEGFVADRSSLDYAAFWMHYGLYEDHEATEAFMASMCVHGETYDRVVLLPWGVLELEADGVRTTNRWVQLRYQGILEGCLRQFLPEEKLLVVPELTSLQQRHEFVLSALQ